MWGKRRGGRTARTHRAVHPHACGGNSSILVSTTAMCGSSPRMWGKRTCQYGRRLSVRFIPTHVGEAQSHYVQPVYQTVHPHACGGNSRRLSFSASDIGSSPRMWGKLRGDTMGLFNKRFIPTHVGKTSSWSMPASISCGSSPRMWGELIDFAHLGLDLRFIPTHVGETN